ncbi:unnamed protein product [Symbiodinium sp. CCMP2592]|nr:unnamed protein product [Symbiodinium sp. CCMP2592]
MPTSGGQEQWTHFDEKHEITQAQFLSSRRARQLLAEDEELAGATVEARPVAEEPGRRRPPKGRSRPPRMRMLRKPGRSHGSLLVPGRWLFRSSSLSLAVAATSNCRSCGQIPMWRQSQEHSTGDVAERLGKSDEHKTCQMSKNGRAAGACTALRLADTRWSCSSGRLEGEDCPDYAEKESSQQVASNGTMPTSWSRRS